MDILTHGLLGATIGAAVLGRRVGRPAMAWGALAALLPDADVALRAFLPALEALALHRTYTHSLVFVVLAATTLAVPATLLHRHLRLPWGAWAFMLGAALLSHIVLDLFTVEGVCLFLPFHAEPVAFGTIALIDPLYTAPLLAAVLAILWRPRESHRRRVLAWTGLALSTLYLGLTVANKVDMQQRFHAALAEQDIPYERLLVQPTLFNNLLWRGAAETPEGYYIGFRSRLDGDEPIRFRFFARGEDKLAAHEHDPALARLRWLTRGWFRVERDGDALVLTDMRFGTGTEWRDDGARPCFAFRLADDGDGLAVERLPCGSDFADHRERLGALLARMLGRFPT